MLLPVHQSLIAHIRKFVDLSDDEIQVLLSCLKTQSLKKKTHLLKEGEVCGSQYFIIKGCLRLYFLNEKGVEHITQFGIENWWIADYMSLDQQKPARFNIQAIEDSEVIILTKRMQEELLVKLPRLEKYFRVIFQKSYAALQMRILFLFSQSGEERYHHFNNAFPGFVQRVPQYMLASFLGFTPEFLSKIRAKNS